MRSSSGPAAIGAAGLPFRFSASRIERYITCPLQAKFRYLDKLPDPTSSASALGKCVHHALEAYNLRGDLEETVSTFLYAWEHPETLEAAIEVWTYGSDYAGYRKRGIDMLRNYHESVKTQQRQVIAVEHEFIVPFGPYELYGFVDVIELRRNGNQREIHLGDYKTSKRLPKISALPWNVQFTVYAYAATQPEFWLGHKAPDKTTLPIDSTRFSNSLPLEWGEAQHLDIRPLLYHLETGRTLEAGVRGDEDFMRLYRVCTEIEKAFKHDVYVPNVSGESCGWCAYKEPCGLPVPKENSNRW